MSFRLCASPAGVVGNLLYRAKVTGGGAGVTVAVFGRSDAYEGFGELVSRYGELRQMRPYVFEGSSMGTDRFGVVVQEG